MKEQQTAPLTTEELTEKYHKLRRTFILATVISIFGTIVMLPSVLFFKVPYALAGALVLLTGESMRYRIKKEMRALAPWILASGVLNETFEDVRYQPSGCLSRETLLESGLPLPEFEAVQGTRLRRLSGHVVRVEQYPPFRPCQGRRACFSGVLPALPPRLSASGGAFRRSLGGRARAASGRSRRGAPQAQRAAGRRARLLPCGGYRLPVRRIGTGAAGPRPPRHGRRRPPSALCRGNGHGHAADRHAPDPPSGHARDCVRRHTGSFGVNTPFPFKSKKNRLRIFRYGGGLHIQNVFSLSISF